MAKLNHPAKPWMLFYETMNAWPISSWSFLARIAKKLEILIKKLYELYLEKQGMELNQQLTKSRISSDPRHLTFKCREIDEYPSANSGFLPTSFPGLFP